MQYILDEKEYKEFKEAVTYMRATLRIRTILFEIHSSTKESMVNKFKLYEDFVIALDIGIREGKLDEVLQLYRETFGLVDKPIKDLKSC